MRMIVAMLTMGLIFPMHLRAGDAQFEAAVDKNPVGLGERFQLSLTLSNAGMGGGENLKTPDLSEFYVLSGPNKSSSMRIINGSVSSSVTYGYVLQARDLGTYTLGPATIEADNIVYSTNTIDLEVVQGSPQSGGVPGKSQPASDANLSGSVFLRAEVDKRRATQGEQINLTFKLYTRVSIQNYTISKNPTLTGFWGEEVENPKNISLTTETINGQQFRVGVIRKVALFPTQAGKLEISPMEVQTVVQIQDRQRFDPFESFFRDPFGKSVNYAVRTDPITIEVAPLPKRAPASFKGAVGRFSMTSDIDRETTRANEPVALKVTISGTGNVKLLETPLVEIPPGFESFSPKVSDRISKGGDAVSGSKTFEYLMIPRYPGDKLISPVEFTYYDLNKKEYVTLRSKPLSVTVEPGTAIPSSSLSGPVRESVELLSEDIRFIKVGQTSLSRRDETPYATPFFLGMAVLPLLTFAGTLMYARRREAVSADMAGYRTRRAARVAQKGLKRAAGLLKQDDNNRFYDEIARSVWKYISDKLSIQQADLSVDRALEQMTNRGVGEETTGRLKRLLEECEMARFTPASAESAEMKKVYEEALQVVTALEKQLRSK